jgi:hypothetical protein
MRENGVATPGISLFRISTQAKERYLNADVFLGCGATVMIRLCTFEGYTTARVAAELDKVTTTATVSPTPHSVSDSHFRRKSSVPTLSSAAPLPVLRESTQWLKRASWTWCPACAQSAATSTRSASPTLATPTCRLTTCAGTSLGPGSPGSTSRPSLRPHRSEREWSIPLTRTGPLSIAISSGSLKVGILLILQITAVVLTLLSFILIITVRGRATLAFIVIMLLIDAVISFLMFMYAVPELLRVRSPRASTQHN